MASIRRDLTITGKPALAVLLLACACALAGIVLSIWTRIWAPGQVLVGALLVWTGLFAALASAVMSNSRRLRFYNLRVISGANRFKFWLASASAALVLVGIVSWLFVSGNGDLGVFLIGMIALLALAGTVLAQIIRLQDTTRTTQHPAAQPIITGVIAGSIWGIGAYYMMGAEALGAVLFGLIVGVTWAATWFFGNRLTRKATPERRR